MFKTIVLLLILGVYAGASQSFVSIFEITKGAKKLGSYEISFEKEESLIVTKSNGVSNKVKYFVDKNIWYIQDGHKQVAFFKNQKIHSFEIKTKLSAIDKQTKDEYKRKLKKVKKDSMLLITKTGKKRIELFNKRKVVIKTLDELIIDAINDELNYEKFILFDKFGVMKMVARVSKSQDGYIIINKTKKKNYLSITMKDSTVVEVKSLVSNWKMALSKRGTYKKNSIKITELLDETISKKIANSFAKVEMLSSDKLKTTKKYYSYSSALSLTLPSSQDSKKNYEKAKFCKKMLKKAHIKHSKINIDAMVCSTNAKIKLSREKQNKKMIANLSKKHKQLEKSKKIQIAKTSISYKLFQER